jgi:hypothetical protein
MELICTSCGRRWTPKKRQRRTRFCPGCKRKNLSSAMVRAWDRRKRLEAAPVALPEAGPAPPDTLEELIRQADRVSARALEAALSLARKRD